jgi:hypothetical protein
MTPPATAAARTSHRSAPGSRRAAVRHPRRISGPAGPVRSVAAAVAIPAPGVALPRQRPARPAVKPRRRPTRRVTRGPMQGAPGIAVRAAAAFEGVASSAVLDRLIRGRAWIGLLAFALIGIVAMQLLVLQLNTGIGRTLTRVAQLQRENAQLGIEDSTYSAESRIAPLAAATGMTLAPVGTAHFVATSPSDLARAASVLSAPIQAPASGLAQATEASASSSTEAPSAAESTGSTRGEAAMGAGTASSAPAAAAETRGSTEGSGSASSSGSSTESSSPPPGLATEGTASAPGSGG